MVSIHMVSVSVQLIISLVYFIFRFKREALHCRSLHVLRLLELPYKSKRATQNPTRVCITTPPMPAFAVGVRVHQWLHRYLKVCI